MGVDIIVTEYSYNGGRFILAACYCQLVLRWEDSARDADFPCRTAWGNPWCGAFWGRGAFPASPVSWGGCGRLWHGCSLSLARDSPARGGGRGLPGSRDEEARPGRPGSSLVTRASVACKQSLEDNGKRGKGAVPGTRLLAGFQIPVLLVGLRRREIGRWGGHPGSPESRSTLTTILKEGILVSISRRQGAFPIPESGRPPPLSHLLSHRPDSQATWDWATLGKAGEGLCAGQDRPPTETQTGGNQEPGSRPLFARFI